MLSRIVTKFELVFTLRNGGLDWPMCPDALEIEKLRP